MARCASDAGYYLAFEPTLRLRHVIPAERVKFRYLCKLSRSLKRSGILLDRVRTGSPSQLHSSVKRALKFSVEVIRKLNPSLRRWIIELYATVGEIEARSVVLSEGMKTKSDEEVG